MQAIHNAPQRLLGWVLLWALLALIPAAFAAGQAASPAPKSFATSHSVVVIGPNSPLFDSLLAKDFPGVDQVNYFQQIKPLLAIIHNNTRRAIKAYAVHWIMSDADGSSRDLYARVIQEPVAPWAVTGQAIVLGAAGTGSGTQLTSPFFHWTKAEFPGLLGIKAAAVVFESCAANPMMSRIGHALQIDAKLDGAIFGDGVFVGPDHSELYERFQAAQQADVDEADWVANLLGGGATVEQITSEIHEQLQNWASSTGTGLDTLYTSARSRAAKRLLRELDQGGQAALEISISRLSRAKRLTLRRKTVHGGSQAQGD